MRDKNDLRNTVYSKNWFVRYFFKKKFEMIIRIANIQKGDVVLDFGGGEGYLKKTYPEFNIINYDITPEHTEIEDYTLLHPNKILVVDVFEHIPSKEIRAILKNFKLYYHDFVLITSIPLENSLTQNVRVLAGKSPKTLDHCTTKEEILKILDEELQFVRNDVYSYAAHIGVYSHTSTRK